MGNADQDISAGLQGVAEDGNGNPTQTALAYRYVRVRGRQIPHGLVSSANGPMLPFAWPNTAAPASTSAFDALTGTAEQVASRFIDPVGNVVNFFTVWVTDWLWKLDGCPTPLPQARLAQYLVLANQLNPWPSNYAGISKAQFPGEDFATYPAWPAAADVDLDTFLPSAADPNGSSAAGKL